MEALNNLPPFYVGHKAVAKESVPGIIKDKDYIVEDIFQCSCGQWYLHPKGILSFATVNGRCRKCDCLHSYDYKLAYFFAERFAPIQESNFPLMTFEKIKEKEEKQILILN